MKVVSVSQDTSPFINKCEPAAIIYSICLFSVVYPIIEVTDVNVSFSPERFGHVTCVPSFGRPDMVPYRRFGLA